MATQLVLLYYYLLLAGSVSVVSGFTPVTYPARVSSECGHYDPLQDEQLTEALKQVHQQLGPPGCNPPRNRSCQEILHCFPSVPSGYYQITAPNGSLVQVYCDMEGTNCGGEGGWSRVAYVNMSQSGATCPQGLTSRTLSGLTLCGRMNGDFTVTTSGGGGCQSTVFSTPGLSIDIIYYVTGIGNEQKFAHYCVPSLLRGKSARSPAHQYIAHFFYNSFLFISV